ncbi:MAG: ABC transporter substrate-binding protein [Lachnospiraceae bacterium]|nr:ABC transporter substrate-binding protein [Lachnospiraceae bacterium]
MKKKRCSILLAVCLAAGLTAGCGKPASGGLETEEKVGKAEEGRSTIIVTMPTSSEPEAGFDPVYGWGAGEHVHEPLIQSTLLRTNEKLELEQDLATGYQVSEDGLCWTVTIREDVRFTDGEPLTAADVAFTYNTCRDNSSVNDFTMLKEAVAVGEYQVEFRLNRAYSIWPYTMANVGIVPEHAYDESYGTNPIGSGRYMMKQWDKGQQVILEVNPDYYGTKPGIDRVTVLFMTEETALAAALAGEVDVAHTAAVYTQQQPKGFHLFEADTVDNRGINLPTIPAEEKDGLTYGNDFLSDVKVRRAINLGIDRRLLIEHTLKGYGTPAYSVCDGLPWYEESSQTACDVTKAQELLTEAGWLPGADGIREKDGAKAEFTVMFNAEDSLRQALAEEVKNQLAELGILVITEAAGWDVAYDKAQSQALVWGWGAHTPMELYNLYHSMEDGLAEYSPYYNEAVDSYMDQALACNDMETSYELWKKAQWDGRTGITQEGDIPWIWLCNVKHLYFVRDGLTIAEQKIHPHGHGWSLINNIDAWSWE